MNRFVVSSRYSGCDAHEEEHGSFAAAADKARLMHFNGAYEIAVLEYAGERLRRRYELREGGQELVEVTVGYDVIPIFSPRGRTSPLAASL